VTENEIDLRTTEKKGQNLRTTKGPWNDEQGKIMLRYEKFRSEVEFTNKVKLFQVCLLGGWLTNNFAVAPVKSNSNNASEDDETGSLRADIRFTRVHLGKYSPVRRSLPRIQTERQRGRKPSAQVDASCD
jgi:hypothetical protein